MPKFNYIKKFSYDTYLRGMKIATEKGLFCIQINCFHSIPTKLFIFRQKGITELLDFCRYKKIP